MSPWTGFLLRISYGSLAPSNGFLLRISNRILAPPRNSFLYSTEFLTDFVSFYGFLPDLGSCRILPFTDFLRILAFTDFFSFRISNGFWLLGQVSFYGFLTDCWLPQMVSFYGFQTGFWLLPGILSFTVRISYGFCLPLRISSGFGSCGILPFTDILRILALLEFFSGFLTDFGSLDRFPSTDFLRIVGSLKWFPFTDFKPDFGSSPEFFPLRISYGFCLL